MTNEMYLSLDLYKIVSDYSGVNQLKFPPTTIQILNALTAYIKNYDDSVKTLQEKVDNLTTDGLPNYMELESATSGETQDSVIKLNGIMNVENGANTVNGEYHISIPTDGTLKVTGLGKMGVDFIPKYHKKVVYYNDANDANDIKYLTFEYISNNNTQPKNLYEAFKDVQSNYGFGFPLNCDGAYLPTDTLLKIFMFKTDLDYTSYIDVVLSFIEPNGVISMTSLVAQNDELIPTFTCNVKQIFVPARTDTI